MADNSKESADTLVKNFIDIINKYKTTIDTTNDTTIDTTNDTKKQILIDLNKIKRTLGIGVTNSNYH
jgi:hypothetical protein